MPNPPSLYMRESLSRGLARSRKYTAQQGKWGTRAALTYLLLAQSWKESEGSRIAQQSGQIVEDIAAEMGYLKIEKEFRSVLKKLKRANISARRVVGLMSKETDAVSHKTNDQIGWTASFLERGISILGEEYSLSASYIQKLKNQVL